MELGLILLLLYQERLFDPVVNPPWLQVDECDNSDELLKSLFTFRWKVVAEIKKDSIETKTTASTRQKQAA